MYYHQSRKQDDWTDFRKAMLEELQAHIQNKSVVLVKRDQVPPTHKVLPAVWAMRRKRRADTGSIYKWKDRVNIDGSRKIKGVHYEHSYSPVVLWEATRVMLVLDISKKWRIRHIYVQAFPQAFSYGFKQPLS